MDVQANSKMKQWNKKHYGHDHMAPTRQEKMITKLPLCDNGWMLYYVI